MSEAPLTRRELEFRAYVGSREYHRDCQVARDRWELEHVEFLWPDGSWRDRRPPSGSFHEHDSRKKYRRKATK